MTDRLAALPLDALPHHDGSELYVSSADPALGDRIRVRLRIPAVFGPVAQVRTRSNPDREPRWTDAELVARVDGADWWEADLFVENPVHGYRWLVERAGAAGDPGELVWVNAAGCATTEVRDVDDFRIVVGPPPPAWGATSVMYQIFPDRFARSATSDGRELPEWAEPADWDDEVDQDRAHTPYQFYGGDLAGIVEHLDHLAGLGVDLIYLTPVFPARSTHRYDALSFDRVDPLLGGDEALIALVEAAHARGMRVIGDLTTNHSGDAHEWFRAAHRNPDAPESDFYLWLDEQQENYASWLGVSSLPKFDWRSEALRKAFIEGPGSVVAKYLEPPFDLDGWRIDVANMTGRFRDLDLNREVRRTVRATMAAIDPDTLLVAESTNDAAPDFEGDAWHGAMTYANFTRPLWNWLGVPGSPAGGGLNMALNRTTDFDGATFLAAHRSFAAAFPWRVRRQNMNALDTHDTPRFTSVAREGVVPVAVGLAMTLPGIPVIWAGDEFGLDGVDGEHSRTPLPWSRTADPAIAERIALYSAMVELRRAHPAFTAGGIRWIHASTEAVAFVREHAEGSVLVVAARSATEVALGAELPDHAQLLRGSATVASGRVATAGPEFLAWALPGPALPAFT